MGLFISPSDWMWCSLCEQPFVSCDICNNTSCNGGGCGACDEKFQLASEMMNNGTAPPKENLKSNMAKEEWDASGW